MTIISRGKGSLLTFAESRGDGSVPHLRGLESGELLDLILS